MPKDVGRREEDGVRKGTLHPSQQEVKRRCVAHKSRNGSRSISSRDLEEVLGKCELKAAASRGGGHRMLVFHCESFNTIWILSKHVYDGLFNLKFKNVFKRQQPKASLLAVRQLVQSTARCLRQPQGKSLPGTSWGSEAPSPRLLSHGQFELRAEVQVSLDLPWRSAHPFCFWERVAKETCRKWPQVCISVKPTQFLPVLPGVRRPFC